MNNLNPTTVSEAGRIMAPFFGYSWEENRGEVVDGINRYREHLYNMYGRRKLFDSVYFCSKPSKFPLKELNTRGCDSYFYGLTLPADTAGVVAAWKYGHPLVLGSRWREAHTGMSHHCGHHLDTVTLPMQFPTFVEMDRASILRFFAGNRGDDGKVVHVVVWTPQGTRKVAFTLKYDEWVYSPILAYKIVSISFPEMCGSTTLGTEGGITLSTYAPWERSPSYLRVKFLGSDPGNVFIQGARRFVPVWFDEDIVEVGSRNVMEFFAQYVRYNKSRDPDDRRIAEEARKNAEIELDGVASRLMAGAIQDKVQRRPKSIRRLPGYR